jgi:hypothetical protein
MSANDDNFEQILDHLPESVRLLWWALRNTRDLWRVLRCYGGQSLRVPRKAPRSPDHPLLRNLGPECLDKLTAAFGGTVVYVPRCEALRGRMRQRQIVENFRRYVRRGMSGTKAVAGLASRYSLSDRRIWQILKTENPVPRGVSLPAT